MFQTSTRSQVRRGSVALCAATAAASAPAASTSAAPEQYQQVLYVASIDRLVPLKDAEAQLLAVVPQARHVQVIGFNSKSYRHPKGFKHKGFAYVVLPRQAEVAPAQEALANAVVGSSQLQVSAAVSIPKAWKPQLLGDEEELASARERRAVFKEHRARSNARRTLRHVSTLGDLICALPLPGGEGVLQQYQQLVPGGSDQAGHYVDWDLVPRACDPAQVGYGADTLNGEDGQGTWEEEEDHQTPASVVLNAGQHVSAGREKRGERKRVQVESFALVLAQMLQYSGIVERGRAVRVVDFGSGTGNLLLPLAALFPWWHFHAVDLKEWSVKLLLQRAELAGLDNVSASVEAIQQHAGAFDVALALHACGSATDHALLQAVKQRAAFIVSPCCVGKLKRSLAGLDPRPPPGAPAAGADAAGEPTPEIEWEVEHPRSQWMTSHLPAPLTSSFAMLAAAADYSHRDNHSHPELAQLAKANIELDRLLAAAEGDYSTALLRLLQPAMTTKADVLVGVPRERAGSGELCWVWR